ncbi:MAG: efflux RND transporter periplasmic adaptor subunit, partial [Mycobacteriales bacterium]
AGAVSAASHAGGAGGGGGASSAATTSSHAGATITPQQIAADQASIDSDTAQLTLAQQNLAAAQLHSPIAGEVVSVSIAPGDSLPKAGSAQIVVITPRSFEVVAPVTETDIDGVAVGESASVLPDGSNAALSGSVSAISLLPASSASTTTYPVTIALTAPAADLFAGASAQVSLVERSARDVLTVPTSALHRFGNRYFVYELASGRETQVPVTVGVLGPVRSQVTAGVHEGTRVVLADLSAPLPTSNSLLARVASRLGRTGLVGGGGGGGRFVRGGGGGGRFVRGG